MNQEEWDGTERRQHHDQRTVVGDVNLVEIWRLLRELEMAVKLHMEEEKELKPKLLELLSILDRSKGVIGFLKVMVWIGAPFTAFVYWVKDHVKW